MDVMSGVAAAHLRQWGYKVKKLNTLRIAGKIEKAWVSDNMTEQLPTYVFLVKQEK